MTIFVKSQRNNMVFFAKSQRNSDMKITSTGNHRDRFTSPAKLFRKKMTIIVQLSALWV